MYNGVSATKRVLVGVRDYDSSLRLFGDEMRFKLEWQGTLSSAQATAWGLASQAQARICELSCNGYRAGRIWLAEFAETGATVRADSGPSATDGPLDIGPKAIDFYVADPIERAVAILSNAGYAALGEDSARVTGTSYRVVNGPDGVPLLLMVGVDHVASARRTGSPDGPFGEVATVSIVTGDIDASRLFYHDALGLEMLSDRETEPKHLDAVADLVNAPRGTRIHVMTFVEPGEGSGKILAVRFLDTDAPRLVGRMRPGAIGFSLLSHDASDLAGLAARINAAGGEIVTPPVDVVRPCGQTKRIMLARGPNEDMYEFVERGPEK